MKGRAPFVWGLWLLLTAAAAVFSACQSTPPPPQASPTATAAPIASVDAASCRQLIMAANLADAGTIQSVDACRFQAAGETASSQVLAAGGTPDQLWAAVWVYSSIGTDPAVVRPLASNSDPTLRAMAAATLVAFGDRTGFDPLAALLTSAHQLRGSDPPMTIGDFSTQTLETYVSAPSAPKPDLATDGGSEATAWASWLAANEAALQFSSDDGLWKLP